MGAESPHYYKVETGFIAIRRDIMRKIQIAEGTVIDEIETPDVLADYISHIAYRLVRQYAMKTITVDSNGAIDAAYGLEEYAKRHKFNGELKNFSIIVLPLAKQPDKPQDNQQTEVAMLGTKINPLFISAELHSTGKGCIGYVYRSVTLKPQRPPGFDPRDYWVRIRSQAANTQQTRNMIEELLHSSLLQSDSTTREALRRICSGGLPSLGKRR